jgi:trigger factor
MIANETREFDVVMADDPDYDEDVRGKTVHFTAGCKEVYSRTVPELNDEFAQSAGDYDTLEELRTKLKSQLEDVAKQRANDTYLEKVFEQLEPIVRVTYPPIMLQERIDEMVEDFDRRLRAQNLNVQEYLRLNSISEEQLREDFREAAERSLIRALILSQIVRQESISATDEEIEDEIKTMMLSFGAQAAMASQFLRSPDTRRAIASRLLSDRAVNQLIDIARGVSSSSEASTEASAKPKKSSRKKTAAKATDVAEANTEEVTSDD